MIAKAMYLPVVMPSRQNTFPLVFKANIDNPSPFRPGVLILEDGRKPSGMFAITVLSETLVFVLAFNENEHIELIFDNELSIGVSR